MRTASTQSFYRHSLCHVVGIESSILYFSFLYFWDGVLPCSPDGSGTCWVYQAGLEIKDTHLLLPPEGLDERWAPSYLTAFSTLRLEAVSRGGSSHPRLCFHILLSIEPKKEARLILCASSHNPTATCQSEDLYSLLSFSWWQNEAWKISETGWLPSF